MKPALEIPGCTGFYKGKVRDVYFFGSQYIAMVATDRISAFDVVLPELIPGKGMVLNRLAASFLFNAASFVPIWLVDSPHPRISVGYRCEPLTIEVVVRAYLAGHAWRTYASGNRELCGEILPDGLVENQRLQSPIITPTTKANQGHDEDISEAAILSRELCSPTIWNEIKKVSLKLFQMGTEYAASRGLILVDTKYEFGLFNGKLMLMDEIHTPDSSRFFEMQGYSQRLKAGQPQIQLSKEFLRVWLMENGFMGKPGETIPTLNPEMIAHIASKYQELATRLTNPLPPISSIDDSNEAHVNAILKTLASLHYAH